MRLRLAIHEGTIAIRKIREVRILTGLSLNGQKTTDAVESWRRAYIAACNRATLAIDALWDDYQWPADGARTRDYEWRPTNGFKRQA